MFNYDGPDWPADLRLQFEHYMEDGGGLVIVHAATTRFPSGRPSTMFLSMSGEPLHQVGSSIKLHFNEPFYVGLGVCSHDIKLTEKAVFSNVELKALPPPQPATLRSTSTLRD